MNPPAKQKRPVVFLDRDGTLNEEVGYIKDINKLHLIEGAADAVHKLNRLGVAAVVVTNQTGAARGYYPEEHIIKLNERLANLLAAHGARLDSIYYCPHLESGIEPYGIACECRKPKPGLVKQALAEHSDLDANRAYVVGDKATDVELAHNCKMKGVLVKTGYGQQVIDGNYQWPVTADYTACDIADAINWILSDLKLVDSK